MKGRSVTQNVFPCIEDMLGRLCGTSSGGRDGFRLAESPWVNASITEAFWGVLQCQRLRKPLLLLRGPGLVDSARVYLRGSRLTVAGLSPAQALGTSCFWHAEWRMSKKRRSQRAKASGCVDLIVWQPSQARNPALKVVGWLIGRLSAAVIRTHRPAMRLALR